MTDIKPRVVDGVPWCDAGCPMTGYAPHSLPFITCTIDDRERCCSDDLMERECCHISVRRMAVELEAWRSGRLLLIHVQRDHGFVDMFAVADMIGRSPFHTIDAAVDALMEEE